MHTWCSGVYGDLSLVVDGFRCKRCDSTIQEADLAEDIIVEGEMYDCLYTYNLAPFFIVYYFSPRSFDVLHLYCYHQATPLQIKS